jgi:uncharacterized membrane protein
MIYLSALALFFIMHIVPFRPRLRNLLVERLGEKRYKLIFRLCIIGIVILGVFGWSRFPNVYFYEPSQTLKQVHLVLMFPAVYLWVLAEIPNNLKRFIRHPMLTGMKLWALGHLLANGDLRSMLLFISFLIFSVLAVIASNRRDGFKQQISSPFKNDIAVFFIAITLYCVLVNFHGQLFGMPIKPYFPFI